MTFAAIAVILALGLSFIDEMKKPAATDEDDDDNEE